MPQKNDNQGDLAKTLGAAAAGVAVGATAAFLAQKENREMVGEKLEEVAENVQEALGEAQENIEKAVEEAKETASDVAGDVSEKLNPDEK